MLEVFGPSRSSGRVQSPLPTHEGFLHPTGTKLGPPNDCCDFKLEGAQDWNRLYNWAETRAHLAKSPPVSRSFGWRMAAGAAENIHDAAIYPREKLNFIINAFALPSDVEDPRPAARCAPAAAAAG